MVLWAKAVRMVGRNACDDTHVVDCESETAGRLLLGKSDRSLERLVSNR